MGESAALDEATLDEAVGGESESFANSEHPLGSERSLDSAIEELSGLGDDNTSGSKSGSAAAATGGDASDLIWDIPVDVNILLGTTQLSVARLMALEPGEVVELNRRIGEPLDITVNGRRVAKGEIVMREDDTSKFAIQVVEIIGR
ncbi:MAG: flagellar motor switch protein FliN [Rhizobiaceae bacterium]|nr:flagellar motor switch protein FliN [Hyphomicrobiales bacterium]NRB30547.1 flagellar motor switch protein FliN [Rhizobiaceae bacterium]